MIIIRKYKNDDSMYLLLKIYQGYWIHKIIILLFSLLIRELDESNPEVHDYTDDLLDMTKGETIHKVEAHAGDEQNHVEANAEVNEGSVSAEASVEGSVYHSDLGNGWTSDVLHESAAGSAELGYVGTNEEVEADAEVAHFENETSGTRVDVAKVHLEAGAGFGAGGVHATAGVSEDLVDVHQDFGIGHGASLAFGLGTETGFAFGPHQMDVHAAGAEVGYDNGHLNLSLPGHIVSGTIH